MITNFEHTAATLLLRNGESFGLQPGTNQVVVDIKGWHGSAGVRTRKTPKLWQHGIFAERGWKTERVITLQGHITTEDRGAAAALCDSLAAILGDGEFGTFTVDDAHQGIRSAEVKLAGGVEIDWDSGTEIDVTVDMEAPDPRKYGPIQTGTTSAAAGGGGMDNDPSLFNDSNVIDFGDAGSAGSVTIFNSGTAPAAVLFEVAGMFTAEHGFTIIQAGSGRRLRYVPWNNNQATDRIVLDSASGTVLMNGVPEADRSTFLIERDWPLLLPGSNTFIFEAPQSPATMTVKAAPAWW